MRSSLIGCGKEGAPRRSERAHRRLRALLGRRLDAMSDQITPEGYEALKAEVAELEGPARREIAERIKTAREWGDLKENSEYHDAKNDQAFLETRILRLTERLRNAEVVEATDPGGSAS